MSSEVEKRPMLVTVGIGVNGLNCTQICWGMIEIFRSSSKVLGNLQQSTKIFGKC